MNIREMDILTQHFDKYFGQDDCLVIHPSNMTPHIDGLLYRPNEAHPYWKLATMGASDYKMQAPKGALGDRNEYVMFIDAGEDLSNQEIADWYFRQLLEVAMYPISEKTYLSYGHSVEWPVEEGEEMVGAYLEMPQVVEDIGILRCKLGLFKTAVCLQVVLLNREETDRLLAIGPEQFSNFLYPEEGKKHFLSQRHRTDLF